jgi:DNA primase
LSLTKIIEPLKRAIYVKETAILFEIEEERIHQQVNLQMQAQLQDKGNKNSAQNPANISENPTQTTDNQGLESGTNSEQIPPNSANSTSVLQPTKGEFFQEKDIIRILILFGDRQFSEQESVAEHILVNVWEILDEMDNELFKNLILEYIQNIESGLKPTLDYFLNHSNPEIRVMSVDFATNPEKYVYSEGWAKRQTYLQSQKMPTENHALEIEQAVNRFKIRKTQRLIDKNRLQLKNMHLPTLEESEDLPLSMVTILEIDRKLRDFLAVFAKAGGTTLLR